MNPNNKMHLSENRYSIFAGGSTRSADNRFSVAPERGNGHQLIQ